MDFKKKNELKKEREGLENELANIMTVEMVESMYQESLKDIASKEENDINRAKRMLLGKYPSAVI